ncbi:MAG TPA: hypothetical protein VHS31_04815 [Tepidisphaeraceae bacterium]|jgi:hypothetical protein|nr:hypothetical protein [Tepidisphaeraceae bacterium]
MSATVCLVSNTIEYPEGGGLLWVYLNWALGLREAGAKVIWLEGVKTRVPEEKAIANAKILNDQLAKFGLKDSLVLFRADEAGEKPVQGYPGLDGAAHADLLLNFQYGLSPVALKRFKKTAMVDIDPGMTQTWISRGEVKHSPHDFYFTIGEHIGEPGSKVPDLGVKWHYTPPAVSLSHWPVVAAPASAPFTTVSHWSANEWMSDFDGSWYDNSKRAGYLPFLELPKLTKQPLELAICLNDEEEERANLLQKGWRVRDSAPVSGTLEAYRQFIQQSRGEFGCAKGAYTRSQGAWISDRTVCYLASGKPSVVQNTGLSRFLPDRMGILRFNNPTEAAECLELAAADYDRQSRAARALAEEYFDARKCARKVLETTL